MAASRKDIGSYDGGSAPSGPRWGPETRTLPGVARVPGTLCDRPRRALEPQKSAVPTVARIVFSGRRNGMPEEAAFMRRALELALQADARVEPNPRVGAVVVRLGRVVGEGFHARVGESHAEVLALRAAGAEARGSTLYVTLEPCNHHGRTPPCVDAILAAGVSRVVAAVADPNPRVAGGGAAALRARGIPVEFGLEEAGAREILAPFAKAMVTGLPRVTLKWAMSLDGRIATRTGDSKWITSEETRARARAFRAHFGAILVGVDTALCDDPSLTSANPAAFTPLRVVADSRARLPLQSSLVQSAREHPVMVAVSVHAPADRVRELESAGCSIFCAPADPQGRVDLRALLAHLVERGVHSVLAEGGARLSASLIESGLADEVRAYLAPLMIGGETAKGPVAGLGVANLAAALRGTWRELERIGPDLFVRLVLDPTLPGPPATTGATGPPPREGRAP